MRVLVTGATGLIGSQLVAALTARGDEVSATSRRPERLQGPFVARHAWDPLGGPADAALFEGVDAVVHLAGEPVNGRWTAAKKRAIEVSRVEGTRRLVAGMRAGKEAPQTFVCASAIGYYGDRGDEELHEGSAPGDDFLAGVCRGWEAAALEADPLGVRVVRLRTGLVLAREGGALAEMLLPAKLGVSGPLGGGRQWWSWIHIQDQVRLLLWALDGEVEGALNAVSPEPVRQRDFAAALGRALGRPSFLPAPAFAIRAALGGFAAEILSSHRVLPARALELGFEFEHPELEPALRNLLG
ncbi:MAG: TIGR01777 family oxidoreductase [Planctomycetota bacterium]